MSDRTQVSRAARSLSAQRLAGLHEHAQRALLGHRRAHPGEGFLPSVLDRLRRVDQRERGLDPRRPGIAGLGCLLLHICIV